LNGLFDDKNPKIKGFKDTKGLSTILDGYDIALGIHADTINSAFSKIETDNLTVDYNDIKCMFTQDDNCDTSKQLQASDLCNVMPMVCHDVFGLPSGDTPVNLYLTVPKNITSNLNVTGDSAMINFGMVRF